MKDPGQMTLEQIILMVDPFQTCGEQKLSEFADRLLYFLQYDPADSNAKVAGMAGAIVNALRFHFRSMT